MSAAANRPTPGLVIGAKYRLVRRLGVGGMAEVWLARNEATGALVAVKLCPGQQAGDEARERFRQEARLGAMLSHRSIVRVFDLVEEDDGTLLLVMELLRGTTLEDHLASFGPLSAPEALAIAIPVLSALAHAHARGIVHRDVTPANVLLAVDPDGHVTPKLVDFGIAKVPGAGVRTIDGTVLGTPRYMSPEQIRGASLDVRSDLFSVGVVLCEMVTGISPFAASSPSGSLAAVLERVVDPDERVDPRLWIEIDRALAKKPYERHASARELADALLATIGVSEADLTERLRQLPPAVEASDRGEIVERTSFVAGRAVGSSPRRVGRSAIVGAGAMLLVTAAVASGPARALRARAIDQGAPALRNTEARAAALPVSSASPRSTTPEAPFVAPPPPSAASATPSSEPTSSPPPRGTPQADTHAAPRRSAPPRAALDATSAHPGTTGVAQPIERRQPTIAGPSVRTPRPVGTIADF